MALSENLTTENSMKSSTFKLSVGLVGFLQNKMPADCEPTRALVGLTERPQECDAFS